MVEVGVSVYDRRVHGRVARAEVEMVLEAVAPCADGLMPDEDGEGVVEPRVRRRTDWLSSPSSVGGGGDLFGVHGGIDDGGREEKAWERWQKAKISSARARPSAVPGIWSA